MTMVAHRRGSLYSLTMGRKKRVAITAGAISSWRYPFSRLSTAYLMFRHLRSTVLGGRRPGPLDRFDGVEREDVAKGAPPSYEAAER